MLCLFMVHYDVGIFWNNQAMCQVMVKMNVQQAIVHRIMKKKIKFTHFLINLQALILKV